MYYYISPSPNDLQHYGVLGMKWGVRRYQNKDGTLTAKGKKHYSESGDSETPKKHGLSEGQKKALKYAAIGIGSAAAIAGIAVGAKYMAKNKALAKNVVSLRKEESKYFDMTDRLLERNKKIDKAMGKYVDIAKNGRLLTSKELENFYALRDRGMRYSREMEKLQAAQEETRLLREYEEAGIGRLYRLIRKV